MVQSYLYEITQILAGPPIWPTNLIACRLSGNVGENILDHLLFCHT